MNTTLHNVLIYRSVEIEPERFQVFMRTNTGWESVSIVGSIETTETWIETQMSHNTIETIRLRPKRFPI